MIELYSEHSLTGNPTLNAILSSLLLEIKIESKNLKHSFISLVKEIWWCKGLTYIECLCMQVQMIVMVGLWNLVNTIWASLSPVKSTHKINHHSIPGMYIPFGGGVGWGCSYINNTALHLYSSWLFKINLYIHSFTWALQKFWKITESAVVIHLKIKKYWGTDRYLKS